MLIALLLNFDQVVVLFKNQQVIPPLVWELPTIVFFPMATHQLVTLPMVNLVMAVLVIQIVLHFQALLIPLVLVYLQLYLVRVLGRNYKFHALLGKMTFKNWCLIIWFFYICGVKIFCYLPKSFSLKPFALACKIQDLILWRTSH